MKYKLNIDTLVIDGYTGTGDIQLTEGDDNTPIAMFDDLHTTKNIRLLGNYLARPIRDPKGLNGEMKRIIMLMHLSRDTDCNVDMIYSKDFKKNSYTNIYERNITFKILLGTKNNQMKLKKVIVSNNTLDGFEISGYLKSQLESVDSINSQIKSLNASIENTFNKY